MFAFCIKRICEGGLLVFIKFHEYLNNGFCRLDESEPTTSEIIDDHQTMPSPVVSVSCSVPCEVYYLGISMRSPPYTLIDVTCEFLLLMRLDCMIALYCTCSVDINFESHLISIRDQFWLVFLGYLSLDAPFISIAH